MSLGWEWRGRNASLFGPTRDREGQIVVELLALKSTHADRLASRWLEIVGDSIIIKPVAYERGQLWLRYAALDWNATKVRADDDVALIAAWLLDAAHAYTTVTQQCRDDIGLFCNPSVQLDVLGRLRLVFQPGGANEYDAPPEVKVKAKAVTWDERSIVYMAGSVVLRRALFVMGGKSPIRDVVLKCLEAKPAKRWQSVEDLRYAITKELRLDVEHLPRRSKDDHLIDEAVGLLQVEYLPRAQNTLKRAMESDVSDVSDLASQYLRFAEEMELDVPARYEREEPAGPVRLPYPLDEGLERARQALRVGDDRHAASIAQQILKDHENQRDAIQLLVQVHLKNGKHEDALRLFEQVASDAGNAATEYLRGKILFATARYEEARASFEKALVLDPRMIEAMLLRREVDRAIASVRRTVGQETPRTIEVPTALSELRDVLLSGDARRAIAALDDARYANEPEAQLVLARFLRLDDQDDRALEVYGRVTAEPHRFTALLGKATTLLDLGRTESALALFDQLVAEKPSDAEASEGRARALETLQRIGEAAAEYRRFISLATVGSDLRVRAAQDWLDTHPL